MNGEIYGIYVCNMKKIIFCLLFFLIYGSKKGFSLTIFYLSPVAAKIIFSAKN